MYIAHAFTIRETLIMRLQITLYFQIKEEDSKRNHCVKGHTYRYILYNNIDIAIA